MDLSVDLNVALIIIAGLGALLAFALIRLFIVERRLRSLFSGKNAKDLEETITETSNHIKKQDNRIILIAEEIDNINQRLAKAIQRVKTVRFNPFKDQGGNQSFATSFLDENGDGVVISSLYSRDKVSIYAKPVAKRQSEYELSDEEREAIDESFI